MKRVIIFALILMIGALYFSFGQESEAGIGWVGNSTHAEYRVNQVCTDGLQIEVREFSEALGGNEVSLTAPVLFSFPISTEWRPESGVIDVTKAGLLAKPDYHPPIGPQLEIVLDTPSETFLIPFAINVPVDAAVGIGNSNTLYQVEPAAECTFFSYPSDQSAEISADEIVPVAQMFDASEVRITVAEVPSTGALSLEFDGVLQAGTQFTAAALLDQAPLLYTPNVEAAAEDAVFRYRVSGISRVSIDENRDPFAFSSYSPSITADGSNVVFLTDGNAAGLTQELHLHQQTINTTKRVALAEINTPPQLSPDGNRLVYTVGEIGNPPLNGSDCFGSVEDSNDAEDSYEIRNPGGDPPYSISRRSMFRFGFAPSDCKEISNGGTHPSLADSRGSNYHVVFQTDSPVDAPNFDDENLTTDLVLNTGVSTELIYGVDELGIVIPDEPQSGPNQIIVPPSSPTPTATQLPIGQPPTNTPTATQLPIGEPPTNTPTATQLPIGQPPTNTPTATPTSTPTPKTLSAPNGASRNPAISANGEVIAYESEATDLVKGVGGQTIDTNGESDIYLSEWDDANDVWDVARVSLTSNGGQAIGGPSTEPDVSLLGNHIVFTSAATNLDPRTAAGFEQVYVRDRDADCTTLLSVNESGEAANNLSGQPSISASGRFVAYTSLATNLLGGNEPGPAQIYVIDRDADGDGSFYSDPGTCMPGPFEVIRVSESLAGEPGNDHSGIPDLADNGAFVAFDSEATNLVPDDSNGVRDVFVVYLGFEGEVRFTAAQPVETPVPSATSTGGSGTATPISTPSPAPTSTPEMPESDTEIYLPFYLAD